MCGYGFVLDGLLFGATTQTHVPLKTPFLFFWIFVRLFEPNKISNAPSKSLYKGDASPSMIARYWITFSTMVCSSSHGLYSTAGLCFYLPLNHPIPLWCAHSVLFSRVLHTQMPGTKRAFNPFHQMNDRCRNQAAKLFIWWKYFPTCELSRRAHSQLKPARDQWPHSLMRKLFCQSCYFNYKNAGHAALVTWCQDF